eukprot:Platyproteum_vivax@DN12958_c0_g1_i1.p1
MNSYFPKQNGWQFIQRRFRQTPIKHAVESQMKTKTRILGGNAPLLPFKKLPIPPLYIGKTAAEVIKKYKDPKRFAAIDFPTKLLDRKVEELRAMSERMSVASAKKAFNMLLDIKTDAVSRHQKYLGLFESCPPCYPPIKENFRK